jgi:hypothetical protein
MVPVGVLVGARVGFRVAVEVAVVVLVAGKNVMLGGFGLVSQKIKIPAPIISNTAAIPKMSGALCAKL